MGSKNNPENRGLITALRTYNGKECEPVLLVDPVKRKRFIAAAYKGGELVKCPNGLFIAYKSL